MRYFLILPLIFSVACLPQSGPATSDKTSQTDEAAPEWISLFNGKDLDGWLPKIASYALGENFANTFQVKNGIIQVNYDQYNKFDAQYGHLFYKTPFSQYHLKLQYRFVGSQVDGGENWAYKNSGVMFHSQAPETMLIDQSFPVSLEAQLLGGNGKEDRPTGNLCTPGLHVMMNDSLITDHCIPANSPTFHQEEWINFELLVYGDSIIRHIVNGDTVLTYSKPVIGGEYLPEEYSLPEGTAIKEGYISLQSESHPIEFRGIYIMDLQ